LSFAKFETLQARLLEIDWVTRGALSIVCNYDGQKRGVSPSTDQRTAGGILLLAHEHVKKNARGKAEPTDVKDHSDRAKEKEEDKL
jgi:hypothetical protein